MIRFLKLSVFLSILGAVLIQTSSVSALAFVPNSLMDSATFDNSGSMNEAQIDAFLNQYASSCISSNNGFTAPDVTGYNPDPNIGFTYGGNVSAGKVIGHAAEAYGINPQVLLSTLQKEQSLVTGSAGCYPNEPDPNWPLAGAPQNGATFTCNINGKSKTCSYACTHSGGCINIAVGYDCPYYCNTSSEGFSKQIIKAAWSLKFHEQRSIGNVGWDIQKTTTVDSSGNSWVSSWNDSDDPPTHYSSFMTQGTFSLYQGGPALPFDGFGTVTDLSNNPVSVHMDTGPTAALYAYTPFESGNQSFVTIFNNFFVPYAWQMTSQYAYTDNTKTTPIGLGNLLPGQRVYLGFTVLNTGSLTWSNTGPNPIDVGTLGPTDRYSQFMDPTWLGPNRPARMKEASVAPGQTATFEFWITAPYTYQGNFNEYLGLVAEGRSWFPVIGLNYSIYVQPPQYTWRLASQYAYTDNTKVIATGLGNIEPGQRKYVGFTVINTGNVTWSNTGPNPMNIGTTHSLDRSSLFADPSWINPARPGHMNEATVAPGQIATFEFWITAPLHSYGSFREYFDLVVEGKAWLNDIGFNYAIGVLTPNYSWQLTSQYAYTDNTKTVPAGLSNMSAGQTAYIGFTALNTSNVTWHNSGFNPVDLGTSNPYDRMSIFCTSGSSWLGCNRPVRMKESSVAPGQNATFEYTITAPTTPGTYREYFSPVVEGIAWMQFIGFNYLITVK